MASVGQASMHAVQEPQWSVVGVSYSKSKSTINSEIKGAYFLSD